MHFNYIPIDHEIHKLQGYLDFLFFNVWINATGTFNSNLLTPNEELSGIYEILELQDSEWGNFFTSKIASIHKEFASIDNDEFKNQLRTSYISNNDIEGLCINKELIPITFQDIESVYPDLANTLKDFYSKLYGSTSPFNLEAFGNLNKKLLADYDTEFMIINSKEICPFCGIHPLKGNNHSYREAYDHYIPKGLYPFNTVNFKNLAPMCHECNSTYKLAKKPIYKNDANNINPIQRELNRSFSFYPYSIDEFQLNFTIELNNLDINNLQPHDIELTIVSENKEEQIESWMRIFGLEERYKAVLCSPNEGKVWINSIIDGYNNAVALGSSLTREQYYEAQLIDAKHILISGKGFLKSIFLEECKSKGVFEIK